MDEDKMIKDFFSAGLAEVEDNGFSERVMRRIPKMRPIWLSVLEGVVLTALAVLAFFYFDGWGLLCSRAVTAIEKLGSIQHTGINPLAWVALLLLVAWYGADRIKNMA